MSKTVFVVGGAGYIGAHICKALAARGDKPVVFDNLSSGHQHAVQWGPLFRGNINSLDDLQEAFETYQPDAVMHFAACIEVAEGEKAPLKFWRNNVAGVITLLEAMKASHCDSLVFSSTCATYGEPESLPLTEREPQTPVSVYGRTKLAVETLLSDVSKADGLNYAALRYFNAAGASPDGEIGEEHDPESHLIPNALMSAAGLGGRMKLFGTDYDTRDGTCIRDYIHVMDLATAHLKALDRLIETQESFVCNLGSGVGFTVKEILDTVEEVVKKPVPYDEHPRRPGDAPVLLADTSTAETLLGFKTQFSDPRTVIKDAWNFHRVKWGLE